jgi:hypothetical protein
MTCASPKTVSGLVELVRGADVTRGEAYAGILDPMIGRSFQKGQVAADIATDHPLLQSMEPDPVGCPDALVNGAGCSRTD